MSAGGVTLEMKPMRADNHPLNLQLSARISGCFHAPDIFLCCVGLAAPSVRQSGKTVTSPHFRGDSEVSSEQSSWPRVPHALSIVCEESVIGI